MNEEEALELFRLLSTTPCSRTISLHNMTFLERWEDWLTAGQPTLPEFLAWHWEKIN